MGAGRVGVDRALVVLQAVALCCLLTVSVLRTVDAVDKGAGLPLAITWLALVPTITALWAFRPRVIGAGHGVEWTVLSVLLATPIAVLGTLNFTIPVLLLVVAFAVVDVSPRAGFHATIWILCVGFSLHVIDSIKSRAALPAGAAKGLLNVIPVAVVLCFGVALGISIRSFETRRNDDQRIINRLRHASEMEKELLLSDERARSARELHDGLGHRLTLVLMSLELAERMRGTSVDQAWEEIRMAKNTTSDALSEMRMWVRALNPVRDASARGLAALEAIAESFRGTGLIVDVSGDAASDHELASDDEVALLVYRSVQEGLTNALRHGRARTVRIRLAVRESQLELAVINDFGRGVEVVSPEPVPDFGFGLRGISERAAGRGGFVYARRVGGEFRLDVIVPLSESLRFERKDRT